MFEHFFVMEVLLSLFFQWINGYTQGRRRMNDRARRAESERSIRRTIYVSDLDQNVSKFRENFTVNSVVC